MISRFVLFFVVSLFFVVFPLEGFSPLAAEPSPLSSATSAGPSPRYGHSMVPVTGGFLVCFGYQYSQAPVWFGDVWRFEISSASWECLEGCEEGENPKPPSRYGQSAGILENTLFIFGGDDGGNSLGSSSYSYNLMKDRWALELQGSRRWRRLRSGKEEIPLAQQCSAQLGEELFIFGGLSQDSPGSEIVQSSALFRWALRTGDWRRSPGLGDEKQPGKGKSNLIQFSISPVCVVMMFELNRKSRLISLTISTSSPEHRKHKFPLMS